MALRSEYLVELYGFDSTKAWTDLFLVHTREQRKAELDDARRDLELKKVAWGRIEGGDRSKLSQTRIRSGWWSMSYLDTILSRRWGRHHEVNKRRAEKATDQRAHELSSPKSQAQKFRKRGGAHKKALLNRSRGSGRFDHSDLGDLIDGCSWQSSGRTRCLSQPISR
jgi:hypothetical protein